MLDNSYYDTFFIRRSKHSSYFTTETNKAFHLYFNYDVTTII